MHHRTISIGFGCLYIRTDARNFLPVYSTCTLHQLPLSTPMNRVRVSLPHKLPLGRVDPPSILPEVPVLGALPLGLPAPGLARRLERGNVDALVLNVSAGDGELAHDAVRVVVPEAAEHGEAGGLEVELVAEAAHGEAVAVGVQVAESLGVERLAGLLLEDDDGEAVVGGALLGRGRQPRHGGGAGLLGRLERDVRDGGRERDVGG